MPTIDLSAGTLDYVDTGGDGPVIVFVHGVVMNATRVDRRDQPLAQRSSMCRPDAAARWSPAADA